MTPDIFMLAVYRGIAFVIAVILLVNAMKFQELIVIPRKLVGTRIGQRRRDCPRECRDRFFDDFVMRQFLSCGINHK